MISLKKLLSEACPDHPALSSLPNVPVVGVECDSRKVGKNFLFVAVRGAKQDGRLFIPEAIARGAVAVMTDKPENQASQLPFITVPDSRAALARIASVFYGHPTKQMKAIGITGTNGKTTSSFLLEHLLKKEGQKVGVIGTVNYRFAGREIPALETTPGPLRLQEILFQMREARCEYVAMEVSSHALEQRRAEGIDFEAGLFTNLTQDHLDYHKTLEAYFDCKSRLFLALGENKIAVLNADDERVAGLRKKLRAKTVTYGIQEPADLKAEYIERSFLSTRFEFLLAGKKIKAELPLIGLHNVYNALGALAVLHGLGFEAERLAGHLRDFPGVPGRLEAVKGGQDFAVFVDFAHTPDGLENVLKTLQAHKKRKLIVLFGCGGDRDKGKRPKMAEIASAYSDFVYVTSDNPRSEDPKTIAEEVKAGFPIHYKNYSVILDRKKAIRQALLSARKDDLVLLAGKGHEQTQIIGQEALPFSDREETEKILSGH